jgi:hypothetical protein
MKRGRTLCAEERRMGRTLFNQASMHVKQAACFGLQPYSAVGKKKAATAEKPDKIFRQKGDTHKRVKCERKWAKRRCACDGFWQNGACESSCVACLRTAGRQGMRLRQQGYRIFCLDAFASWHRHLRASALSFIYIPDCRHGFASITPLSLVGTQIAAHFMCTCLHPGTSFARVFAGRFIKVLVSSSTYRAIKPRRPATVYLARHFSGRHHLAERLTLYTPTRDNTSRESLLREPYAVWLRVKSRRTRRRRPTVYGKR